LGNGALAPTHNAASQGGLKKEKQTIVSSMKHKKRGAREMLKKWRERERERERQEMLK
jgi:hypothetical protein